MRTFLRHQEKPAIQVPRKALCSQGFFPNPKSPHRHCARDNFPHAHESIQEVPSSILLGSLLLLTYANLSLKTFRKFATFHNLNQVKARKIGAFFYGVLVLISAHNRFRGARKADERLDSNAGG
jgi:hypothetical protein